jgi:hypothetical protein
MKDYAQRGPNCSRREPIKGECRSGANFASMPVTKREAMSGGQ